MIYRDLNTCLRERFGTKVYKLALDGGMTCPNRDGTCGTRGCIFCSAGGSGDFAVRIGDGSFSSFSTVLGEAKEYLKKKLGKQFDTAKYIAYFQSYTNTYAPVEYLRELFYAAIEDESVAVLSIATRPDCLPDEVIELLAELNRIKPVWVELGLQTIHEETARFIRRGYELPVFETAVERLTAAGIEIIVHVILGLPGESREDMLETVRYVADRAAEEDGAQIRVAQADRAAESDMAAEDGLRDTGGHMPQNTVTFGPGDRYPGIRGIKLQLLHIMSGTDLGDMFDPEREVICVSKRTDQVSPANQINQIDQVGQMDSVCCEPADVLPLAIHTPEQYIDILKAALEIIDGRLVIHRLTGDAPRDKLIFPKWSANKRLVLNALHKK